MTSGNHLASQGQREYQKRGECPACHRGQLEPEQWCNNWGHECEKDGCPSAADCNNMMPAAKCPYCGYTTTEVE